VQWLAKAYPRAEGYVVAFHLRIGAEGADGVGANFDDPSRDNPEMAVAAQLFALIALQGSWPKFMEYESVSCGLWLPITCAQEIY
jgi:hypothetical protein